MCTYGGLAVSAYNLRAHPADFHAAVYPKGGVGEDTIEGTMRAAFPALAEHFYDGRRKEGKAPRRYWAAPGITDVVDVKRDAAAIPDWRKSPDFAVCTQVRGPNFVKTVGRGVPEAPPPPEQ